jgi:hypothetical protein
MNPSLTEPGIKTYFLNSLRQCNHHKENTTNLTFNLILLGILLLIVGSILGAMYKGKPNLYEKNQRLEKERLYIVDKIKTIQIDKQRDRNQLITGLPIFT